MKKLSTLLLLASLGIAYAEPTWTVNAPAFPLVGPADAWWEVDVRGPAGQKPVLRTLTGTWALEETSPGVYRGRMQASNGDLRIEDQVLGNVQVSNGSLGVFEVTRDNGVFRSGPSSDFDRYTPIPAGARLDVLGRQGDYYWVSPPSGWIRMAEGQLLPPGSTRGNPQLTSVQIAEPANQVSLRLGAPCAWQIRENPEQRTISVDLPGVPMVMHEMAFAQNSKNIPSVRLEQTGAGTTVQIPLRQRLWGYSARWNGKDMVLHITPAPVIDRQRPLRGLKVTLDAGHGGEDLGTVGLELKIKEKDLNLQLTQALQKELEAAGAVVTMTRTTDKDVAPPGAPADQELQSRVDVAERSGAQLFLSIHHNARPEVRDGRVSHGTHIYYYHPHSRGLAHAIAAPLAQAIGESSWMHLWRSFHVIRQTRMPAVLVEANFLSNPTLEAGMLKNPDYARKAAAGIRKGVEQFLLDEQM